METPELIVRVQDPMFGAAWHELNVRMVSIAAGMNDDKIVAIAQQIWPDATGLEITRRYRLLE